MKKTLLTLGVGLIAMTSFAQYPTYLKTDYTATSPCQHDYETGAGVIGAAQSAAGSDIRTVSWDATGENMLMNITRDASASGPYYLGLSGNDLVDCEAGTQKVDISSSKKIKIRAKASEAMTVDVFVQEGSSPSYNYSKFSATDLQMELTTDFQVFELTDIVAINGADAAIDLSQVGMLVFGLAQEEGGGDVNNTITTATITVDYIELGSEEATDPTGIDEAVASSLSVYPNPASDVLNVSFEAEGAAQVEVISATGQVVASQAGAGSIDVSGLASGIYVVSVTTDNGVVTKKVTIQ